MSKRSHVPDIPDQSSPTEGSSQLQHEPERFPSTAGDTTPVHAASRSIAVDSILNPPANPTLESPSHQGSNGPLESPVSSTSPSPSPSPVVPLSQTDPARFRLDRSVSPRLHQRRILTPRSPASRAASLGTRFASYPGTMDVAQFPFIQSPPPQSGATLPGSYSHPQPSFLPEQRTTLPPSQDTAPSTPHSSYSPFQQASPAHMLQQPLPLSQVGLPPFIAHQMAMESTQGLIPVTIDMDSGSKKASDKRKKNSHASRRFRQRKKATENEKARILEKLQEDMKFLRQAVAFYRSERDYFRDYISRIPGVHIPPRPASPQFPEQAPVILTQASESESDGRVTSRRNVRSRTGPPSSGVSLPTPLQPLPFNLPGYQSAQQSPWPPSSATTPEASQQFQPPFHAPYRAHPPASPQSHDAMFTHQQQPPKG
ncbi:hypothetical protein DIZ76_014278 [Coccidioides immitis]|nr:hypothetical protein DIZ76_014278 [Coccidioides immitis]